MEAESTQSETSFSVDAHDEGSDADGFLHREQLALAEAHVCDLFVLIRPSAFVVGKHRAC
jgi:hypothetical protein